MAKTFEVKNLNEAINLANEFKSKGKYNLFRGQAQDWKVVPSLGRQSENNFKETVEKIERLYGYFEANPILEKFINDIDWFYAVAQHYGLPTNYIDFTNSVEVASFFATNSKSNKIGENCVIICLNENDFNSLISFISVLFTKDNVVSPYITRVNVDNLWRLQAQDGCFLFTPYPEIEHFYRFDKIIFPFSSSFDGLTKEEIYPARKSELEILLDYFFNSESRIAGGKRLIRFAKELKIPIKKIPSPDFNKVLKNKNAHPSWKSSSFKEWNFLIKEEWKKLDVNSIQLHFSFKLDIHSQIESIFEELDLFFDDFKIERSSSLQFIIVSKPKLTLKLSRLISQNCLRIWDGTRNLPYTNSDIFYMISKYICLEIYQSKFDFMPTISGENLIRLEMRNEYGSKTRCDISPSKVVSAFRDDIKDILIEELICEISSEILLHINIANLLFDFNKLIRLFKDEMVLYQVLYTSKDENPVVFYTPTEITIIGYA